jgi:hypothetical protein
MFASALAGLSKIDHSRVLCRKVDLRARNAQRSAGNTLMICGFTVHTAKESSIWR